MISWMVICVNCFFEISLHALSGVRVQRVQKVQKVQREKVLRIDRPAAGGFLSLTGPLAPRVADCRSAAMLIKSALRDWLLVSYGMISILVISRCAAPPYPAAPDFPPKGETTHYDLCVAGAPSNHVRCASTGKRVTRFSGRFAPLRIVFPCHPIRGDRIKHLEASLRKRLCSKHGLLCPRLRAMLLS